MEQTGTVSQVEHISWQLDDATCRALGTTDLPSLAPELSRWQSPFGLTLTGGRSAEHPQGWMIRADVSSVWVEYPTALPPTARN